MINKGDMNEVISALFQLLETYRTLVETEEETDKVFKHIVDQNPSSMEEMVRLPMTYGVIRFRLTRESLRRHVQFGRELQEAN
jgi:hypothetical protein